MIKEFINRLSFTCVFLSLGLPEPASIEGRRWARLSVAFESDWLVVLFIEVEQYRPGLFPHGVLGCVGRDMVDLDSRQLAYGHIGHED